MAGDRNAAYVERIIARARELHESNAFEPARGNAVCDGSDVLAEAKAESRPARRLATACGAVTLVAVLASLLLPYWGQNTLGAGGGVYSPADVIDCYRLWFQLNVAPLFDSTLSNKAALLLDDFQATHDVWMYGLVMNRAASTCMTIVCGIMLALSGLLFQTAFRNPLAVPTTLGVSDGVTLGCIVFSMFGYSSISQDSTLYLMLVYGLGALTVAFVILLSRGLTGGARYNILDMLLLGTVICQLLGGVNAYIQNFIMDYTTWENFYNIQMASSALTDPLVRRAALIVFVVTFVPALVLRFKLNLIAFDDDEGRMMGARSGLLRGGALVLGSVMQLASIATLGQVAILSLAVPFLVRYMLPADFRWQFLGNCLVGTTVLVFCMCVQHFVTFGGMIMSVGTVVSFLVVPFFVWLVAFGRGRW